MPVLFEMLPTTPPRCATPIDTTATPITRAGRGNDARDDTSEADAGPADALPLGARNTEELFEKLYQQYEQPIYQYVYRLLGDPEDARDFTQDAFVKAYRKLPETLAKGNFQPQAWLYRIATNVCLDELRHRKLLKW